MAKRTRATSALEAEAEALVPDLMKLQIFMKVDRPFLWSPSFDGLSPFDLHVLAIADARPDVILREVRDYLEVPNSSLTGIVDRLERRGLVERTISPRDRRSFGLRLTEKGRALRDEQQIFRRDMAAQMLSALDDDAERQTFVRLMKKMGDRLAK